MKTNGKQSGLEELHTIQVSVFHNETVKHCHFAKCLYTAVKTVQEQNCKNFCIDCSLPFASKSLL